MDIALLDDIATERQVVTAAKAPAAAQRDVNLVSDALVVLRRRFGWLLLAGLAGLPLALGITSLATPRFDAHAELLVDPRDLHILQNEVTPTGSPSDTSVALVESQARVLGSDNVLRRVIDKLKLADDPEFNGTARGPLGDLLESLGLTISFGGNQDAASTPMETALQKLERQTFVRRPERTYVVELTAAAQTKEKAVAITQAVIDAYLADLSAARIKATADARASIDARLEGLRQNVNQSEAKIAKYKAENNLVSTGGVLVNEQQLTEINNQLGQARAETNRVRSRYQEMQASLADPASSPEAVNSATLRNLKAQLSGISAQQKQLGADLLPSHPTMRAIAAEAQTVRDQMSKELRILQESARHDYERAKATEAALSRMLEGLRKQQVTTNDAQIGLRELQRELDANQSIYQAAILRVREAKEQENVNTANVRVISPAIAERDKVFPPGKRVVLPMGFAAMFGLAWLAFLVARLWRR